MRYVKHILVALVMTVALPKSAHGQGVTDGPCLGDLNGDRRVDLADLGILLADFGCVPTSSANLLTNPGFETPEQLGTFWPTLFGDWAGDVAEIVTAENGITPLVGAHMVHHIYTDERGPSGLGASDVVQAIDVSHLRDEIDRGRVRAIESAYFNRVQGNAQTDTEFHVQIAAHLGDIQTLPSRWMSWIEFTHIPILTDGNLTTWERAEVSMLLPPGTTIVVAWVDPSENVYNNTSGVEFDGHYTDDVSFTLETGCAGDIDGDGDTDLADLGILLSNFGTTCP